MIRRPPRSTLSSSSAASDVYKRQGGGDMMLAAGAGDPDLVDGRAGLADLAGETAADLLRAGTTTVALGLDDTLFTGPAWNPGWHPGHILYVAPIAALAVDRGATSPDPFQPRQADPALEAAKAFATLLTAQGITVPGPTRMTTDPAAVEIAAVESVVIRVGPVTVMPWAVS